MKKLISFIIAVVIFVGIAVPPQVQASSENQGTVSIEIQKEIFKDGNIIGTTYRTVTRSFDEDGKVRLETKNVNKFFDGTTSVDSKVDIVEVRSENEIYVNGEQVDTGQSLSLKPATLVSPLTTGSTVLNSGGLLGYIRFEDLYIPGLGNMTYMISSSGIKNRMTNASALVLDYGGAKDDAIFRTVDTNGKHQVSIINYRYYANSVKSCRDSILQNAAIMTTILGVTGVTAITIWPILVGTGTALPYALAIYNAAGDADTAMSAAYQLLQTM